MIWTEEWEFVKGAS